MMLFSKPVFSETNQMEIAATGDVVDSQFVAISSMTENTLKLGTDKGLFAPAGTKGITGDKGPPGPQGDPGPAGEGITYNGIGSVMVYPVKVSDESNYPQRGQTDIPPGAGSNTLYTITSVIQIGWNGGSYEALCCAVRTQ